MKIGDKLRGVITGIKPYGAFVSLENGTTGLIHISEIKTGYIDNIYSTLKVDPMSRLFWCFRFGYKQKDLQFN